MKLLVDANILIDETLEDSERHEKSCRILDEADSIIIPDIVLYEYLWIMLRRVGASPDFLGAKILEYRTDPRITFQSTSIEEVLTALKWFKEEEEKPEEINDYIILAVCYRNNYTLTTFDKVLIGRAEKHGINYLTI